MDGVMLAYPFFLIAQVWTQTQLLIEAQRHRQIPDFVKLVLFYLIMMNFAEWLQTGISLGFDRDGGQSSTTPIMNTFFSKQGARIIRLCVYPFMVLYRFHSAVVAWEILIETSGDHVAEVRGKDKRLGSNKQKMSGRSGRRRDGSSTVEHKRVDEGDHKLDRRTSIDVHIGGRFNDEDEREDHTAGNTRKHEPTSLEQPVEP